ncbi:MAG: flagellar hook-associated protein FlgK [candidate division Zixibacteria bacterium]|nr:flagellar hook-associated protein FlgK [candidate division Zixibacteria bacterium]
MAGLLDGLEIGKRALFTNQLWLNTIGHNIANVNTPGYSRQRVDIHPTDPQDSPQGSIGTGVEATGIRQVRDLFLNQQYRNTNKSLGQWTARDKTLSQIEALFNEPKPGSLSDLLDKFWASWSGLSVDPTLTSARTDLVAQTKMLTGGFNRIYNQLQDLSKSVDNDIVLSIDKVNQIASDIATLNQQISRSELGGQTANDLRDRRDYLIDQLSEYVDVNVREQKNNTTTVYIGSLAIVDGTSSYKIGTRKINSGEMTTNQIVWEGTTKEIKNFDGQLKGLIDTRDSIVPQYMGLLDEMAQGLITSVNAIHQTGYGLSDSTGLNFFDPLKFGAATISINSDIERDNSLIAAAGAEGQPGDNSKALAISYLRNSSVMLGGTASISEFYSSMIGKIGVEASKAKNSKDNYELLAGQVDSARQSIQGVSLDEEMTQMIKYQHAFDAAARVITTMDQALATIIQEMGIVGR